MLSGLGRATVKRVTIAAALVVAVGLVSGIAPAGAAAMSRAATGAVASAAHSAAATGSAAAGPQSAAVEGPKGAAGARAQFTARRLAALRAADAPAAASAARPAVTSVSPTGGPLGGGTTITVHGTSFGGVQSVTIGGRKARSFHVESATVLTAVTPAHPAGGALVVVTTGAGASTGTVRFRYLNPPALTALSAHSGPVTGGQVVTITGRNLSYATAVRFGALNGKILTGGTATRLRVVTPATWAATVHVTVRTLGGATLRSTVDRYVFTNPAPRLSGKLTPAAGVAVASAGAVTAVSGGAGLGRTTTPWTVTLAATVTPPAVGQQFLLKPGAAVYPSGLAGTVTAVDTTAGTITVTQGPLAAAVQTATAVFTGPLGNASAATGPVPAGPVPAGPVPAGTVPAGPVPAGPVPATRTAATPATSLTNEIDFGKIDVSDLACSGPDLKHPISGSVSLTLTNVEAHVEVDVGSLFTRPFVDVWLSYQRTIAVNLTAETDAKCSIPASYQSTHQKLFFLGDTGATIAVAPDASITLSASGTVTYSQHSYHLIGFVSNPNGSINKLDGESADPASVHVSGELKAEAYGGVQVQVGMLNAIGVGISLGGGVAGTVTSDWPPQVCLAAYPYLRGTLYAYLSTWVKEWKLQAFQVELDFNGISNCAGDGWHVAWQSTAATLVQLTCPTISECFAVGHKSNQGYILRTTNGGRNWTGASYGGTNAYLDEVACSDAAHCVVGGNAGASGRLLYTTNGGASWTAAALPSVGTPVGGAQALTCVKGGTCYLFAPMIKYSNFVLYSSSNSGKTWSAGAWPNYAPNAVTCLDKNNCIAAGSVPPTYGSIIWPAATLATRTAWAGYTASQPKNWKSLESVSCTSTALCLSAGFDAAGSGNDLLASTNFGKSWSKMTVPFFLPWSVSCPDVSTCVIGGDATPNWSQQVATTHDYGHTWKKTTISGFPAADDMNTYWLDCPALGHCVALEYGGGPTAIAVS
jgi:hypothetical protein